MRRNWGWLLRVVAIVSAALALGRGLVVIDRESIAIGAAMAAAVALTYRRQPLLERVGWIALSLLMLNQAVWMIPATVSLASAAPSIPGAAFPSFLSVAALAGLFASVARVRDWPTRAVPRVADAVLLLGIALMLVVPAIGTDAARRQQGDLLVFARDTRFEPDALQATRGDIGVVFRNDDLFWHTFTVSDLDANVTVATAGKRRIVMRDVQPGTYKVVCAIPGHESAGMAATLVVR